MAYSDMFLFMGATVVGALAAVLFVRHATAPADSAAAE